MIRLNKVLLILGLILNLNACSGSSGTSSGGSSNSSALSEFASALAEEMVVASPTSQRSNARSVNLSNGHIITKPNGVIVFSVPESDATPEEKKEALEELLAVTPPATCSLDLNIQTNPQPVECYGPSVTYTNHPLGNDGDGDNNNNTSGSLPSGDLGIWVASQGSEACSAAKLNAQIKAASAYIDMAQFISAGMSCIAKKENLEFPETEETSLELSSYMSSSVTINTQSMNVTSATISRLSNDGEGNPVYVTYLTGTAGGSSYTIRIKHISTSSDDSTNKGKVSVKVQSSSGPGSTAGVSLEYSKTSSTEGALLLKKINFNNSSSADPFLSADNFSVDYNKAWNASADYFFASINPTDYSGKFRYAWQAGNGDSHARVFNALINSDGSGSAYFGFGPKVQQNGIGTIDGMICAWTGPGNLHTPVDEVQKQSLTLTNGVFVATTSKIMYDHHPTCESGGTVITYGSSQTRDADDTTKDLEDVADVTSTLGTFPSAPADIDPAVEESL